MSGLNGPAILNGGNNNYDRAVCFDAPVEFDTGLYAFPTKTLAQLREEMMVRMGYAAMLANPPPGMKEELNSYLQTAQEQLYLDYDCMRTERWWAWQLEPGRRIYDTPIDCTKALNFRKITWAGIADNGGTAMQLFAINTAYSLGQFILPTTYNSFVFEVTTAGTTAATEPAWPTTLGATVVSGTVTFTAREPHESTWYPIKQGINPLNYGEPSQDGLPYCFELREFIEIWPAPDKPMVLWIKGHLGLRRFVDDTDVTTIDATPLFLTALANAKDDRGQPGASKYANAAAGMIRNMVAGSHGITRYHPRPSRAGMKWWAGYYDCDDYGPWPQPRATWR